MGKKLVVYNIFIFIVFVFAVFLLFRQITIKPQRAVVSMPTPTTSLWKYQCIDTMKTSRDKARIWSQQVDLHAHLEQQIDTIKSLGANCIAIDTPYDPEFLPYLTAWVTAAHKKGLMVWFRGNFASWEGWFGYSKGMTTNNLLIRTKQFILDNSTLFSDRDIFTPAPEAENGGPFNQVAPARYAQYRQFLIDEYKNTQQAFQSIGKQVTVNWFSMNGGFARRMLDQNTISSIGDLVTIDHYINSPSVMSDYINYFYTKFHAPVMIGEFGAPIPEINGLMNEDSQAQFVDQIFYSMYQNREKMEGINYWVLYDSSTAILNEDGTERAVAGVIRKYYRPLVISGTVIDSLKKPIPRVLVRTFDGGAHTITDELGRYTITIPNSEAVLQFFKNRYQSRNRTIHRETTEKIATSITLYSTKQHVNFLEMIKNIFIPGR